MKTARLLLTLLTVLSLFVLHAVSYAAEVSQGMCKSFDPSARTLVIEEYDTNITPEQRYGGATGIINSYDTSLAQVGIPPSPGDIIRIAYKADGGKRQALKIMNVTKQNLMKK